MSVALSAQGVVSFQTRTRTTASVFLDPTRPSLLLQHTAMPAHMDASIVAKVEGLARKKGATPAKVYKELEQKLANPPSESR
jgi:hypothetical protein